MRLTLWCSILILASVIATQGQTIKIPESWDRLAAKADEVVNVTMDKKMLQFASKFMDKEDDAEEKHLVAKLNGIYVRTLEFKNTGEFTESDVEPIRAQLQGAEWSRMVDVTSKTESVVIYVKTVNDQTVGMVILAEEPTELTFVHLDGPINPEDISELSGNFGIPKGLRAGGAKKTSEQPKKAVVKK